MNEPLSITPISRQLSGALVPQAQEELPGKTSFKDTLVGLINEVDSFQKDAANVVQQFGLGEVQNIHEVMIAVEKAKISLSLLMEIRNKVIETYQEVMHMQI